MVRGMQFLQAYDKERRWNIIKFSLTSAKWTMVNFYLR
jgi:hypothetical protein